MPLEATLAAGYRRQTAMSHPWAGTPGHPDPRHHTLRAAVGRPLNAANGFAKRPSAAITLHESPPADARPAKLAAASVSQNPNAAIPLGVPKPVGPS